MGNRRAAQWGGWNRRLWPMALALECGLTAPAWAQTERPDEEAMFGEDRPSVESSADAGVFSGGDEQGRAADASDGGTEPERDEDTLFGGPGQAPSQSEEAGAGTPVRNLGPPTDESDRDRQVLEGDAITDAFASEEAVDDPLRIGGLFYQRGIASYRQDDQFKNVALTFPTLVDAYFDGRPTDRIRAFVSGRLTYDPTLDTASQSPDNALDPEGGITQVGQNLFGGQDVQNPRMVLDQAWLRFDIQRAVFLTIGKQHVKWGTSRFWNPTDFLSPSRRNPLQTFDLRTGASMVKVHVPWEERGWNFYALALLDNVGPSDALGKLGGAARAELVFGTLELGLDAVVQLDRKPRFGLDLSTPLGPFDIYGEVALRGRPDSPLWRRRAGADPDNVQVSDFERYLPEGPSPQASGGLTWTWAYNDTDSLTVGAEYFYNSLGTDDPGLYPWLILNGEFTPFYLGRHYAAAYALLAAPGNWENTSFVFSALGNISDRSFLTRLDVTQRVLSFLTVEGFVSGHFGNDRGEFRLGVDVPPLVFPGGFTTPAIVIPPPVFEVGVALRVSL